MTAKLSAQLRTQSGKGVARRLRRDGQVPGTVYGSNIPTQSIFVDAGTLARVEQQAGQHSLIELQVAGDRGDKGTVHRVLMKELARDPVRGDLLHVDFHAVALDQEMQTVVEIILEGEEDRPDAGVVTVVLRELNISCLPTAIPESVSVDVAGLAIGDVVTVADIVPPEGVQILHEPDEAIVTVVAPRVEEADEDDAEAAEGDEAGESGEEESSS